MATTNVLTVTLQVAEGEAAEVDFFGRPVLVTRQRAVGCSIPASTAPCCLISRTAGGARHTPAPRTRTSRATLRRICSPTSNDCANTSASTAGWCWADRGGSTLALAYAERHPDRVTELVLFGITTDRRCEFDWLFRGGVAVLFPEEWDRLLAALPAAERGSDVVDAYYRRLHDPDLAVRQHAAVPVGVSNT